MSGYYIVLIISGLLALLSIIIFIKTLTSAMNGIKSNNVRRKLVNDLFKFGVMCIMLGGVMFFVACLTASLFSIPINL